MGHPETGRVPFEAEGRQYILALRSNELCDIQRALGYPFGPEHDHKFISRLAGIPVVSYVADLRHVFHEATLDPTTDLRAFGASEIRRAGALIDALGIQRARLIMIEAMRWAFPDPPAAAEQQPDPKAESPGPGADS